MSHEKPLRYFVYVRKSTDVEDRQTRSITDQLAGVRELIRREGLIVVGRLEEAQTAMKKGRPIFNERLSNISSVNS